MGKGILSHLILPKGPNQQRPGPFSSIFYRPSPKRLPFFPGNVIYLGVLHMGASLGRIEGEGENGAQIQTCLWICWKRWSGQLEVVSAAVSVRLVMPLFCLMPTIEFVTHRRKGRRRSGNYGTSANSSSQAESGWCLKEFTEEVVSIVVGRLLQYSNTRVEKDNFLRKRRLEPCTIRWLWGHHMGDTCWRRSGPRDVVDPHMAVRENPFTSLVACCWICSTQSALATGFCEQACIAYSRWGKANAL